MVEFQTKTPQKIRLAYWTTCWFKEGFEILISDVTNVRRFPVVHSNEKLTLKYFPVSKFDRRMLFFRHTTPRKSAVCARFWSSTRSSFSPTFGARTTARKWVWPTGVGRWAVMRSRRPTWSTSSTPPQPTPTPSGSSPSRGRRRPRNASRKSRPGWLRSGYYRVTFFYFCFSP